MGELPRWQLVELVIAMLEFELGSTADSFEVDHDVKLPIVDGTDAGPRQIDVLVRGRIGGREFIRIVEIQDRNRRVDQGFVDQVLGKARAVGAHRSTIVSTKGFTKGAISRSGSPAAALDLYEFRESQSEEWPFKFPDPHFDFDLDGVSYRVPLKGYAYVNAASGTVTAYVLFGHIVTPNSEGVVAMISRLQAPERSPTTVWFVVGNWPPDFQVGRLETTWTTPDGRQGRSVAGGTIVPNIRSRRLARPPKDS